MHQQHRTMMTLSLAALITVGMGWGAAVASASVSWDAFVIRNSNVGDTAPTVTKIGDDGVDADVPLAGQKAGFGTSYFNGNKLSSITQFSYTREDSNTGIPYLNIWVTDGTDYALIAPVMGALDNGGYDSATAVNGVSLQSLGFNIYDNTAANYDWLVSGAYVNAGPNSFLHSDGTVVTVSEIGDLIIKQNPGTISDTGAPKNGTGFNLIFGDTHGNYTGAYSLRNVTVPEPTSLALIGLGGLFMLPRRKRRQSC